MSLLHPQTTVGDLVRDRPGRARVFEALNVDYRCRGKLSLAEACERQELDPQAVLQRLQEWACNTYRAMLDGLRQLEWDLHQHIHKENNVLFPKAIRRETELAGR